MNAKRMGEIEDGSPPTTEEVVVAVVFTLVYGLLGLGLFVAGMIALQKGLLS
jgi:hypothetical protein